MIEFAEAGSFMLESSVKGVALPSALFDCVPMPKTSEPVTFVSPTPTGTAAISRITPLLSANSDTGLRTCSLADTKDSLQPELGQV